MTTQIKKMSDKKALDQINEILKADEWDTDTLTYVADIVRATGRNFMPVIDDPWTPQEDGTIICIDCEANFVKEEIFGDPEWSDPRCIGCYESNKYGR